MANTMRKTRKRKTYTITTYFTYKDGTPDGVCCTPLCPRSRIDETKLSHKAWLDAKGHTINSVITTEDD